MAATAQFPMAADERLPGIEVESPGAVAAAVIVSLALASACGCATSDVLVIALVVAGAVFAVVDVTEVARQIDESQTSLAVLAAVIAVGHALAAGSAAGRPELNPERTIPPSGDPLVRH